MKETAVVAWRELVDRRAFVGAAIAAAAMVLVLPMLLSLSRWQPAEIREVLGWWMALGFAWPVSLVLGWTVIGAELTEGRFGFYMARPLSGFAIWTGKLVAVWGLAVLCELMILAPAVLPEVFQMRSVVIGELAILLLGVPLILILIGHAAGVMWRSRSGWLAVDAIALTVVSGLAWNAVMPAWRAEAPAAASAILLALTVGAVTALVAGGALQVVSGRSDLKRGHRALSVTLWGLLMVTALAVFGYSRWLILADPDDLRGYRTVDHAPAGPWIAVSGSSAGRFDFHPRFLIRADTGDWRSIGGVGSWSEIPVVFSGDGCRAAWMAPASPNFLELEVVDLDRPEARPPSPEIFSSGWARCSLSGAGDLVALLERDTVAVYELPTGRQLVAVRMPAGRRLLGPVFVADDKLRIYATDVFHVDRLSQSLQVLEVDVAARRLDVVGEVRELGAVASIELDAERELMLIRSTRDEPAQWQLRHGRTGELLHSLEARSDRNSARLLSDGRVARGWAEGGRAWLETVSPDGEGRARLELGAGRQVALGCEPQPGRLVIAISDREESWPDGGKWSAWAVKLDSGEVQPIGDGLFPPRSWQLLEGARRVAEPGAAISRLLVGQGESLHSWDPLSGELRQLVAGTN